MNYVVHTDAIKEYIVPTLTEKQIKYIYAEEADVLNVALFGMTAKQWREANAELIENNVSQSEMLIRLNNSARRQMKTLQNNKNIAELENLQEQVKNEKYLLG